MLLILNVVDCRFLLRLLRWLRLTRLRFVTRSDIAGGGYTCPLPRFTFPRGCCPLLRCHSHTLCWLDPFGCPPHVVTALLVTALLRSVGYICWLRYPLRVRCYVALCWLGLQRCCYIRAPFYVERWCRTLRYVCLHITPDALYICDLHTFGPQLLPLYIPRCLRSPIPG